MTDAPPVGAQRLPDPERSSSPRVVSAEHGGRPRAITRTVRLDWGSLPAWVAAIGTVGTLAFTLMLVRRELRDRRAEQARLVNAWTDSWRYRYPLEAEPEVTTCDVVVRNSSAQPAYAVRVAVLPWDWNRHQREGGIGRVFLTLPPEQTMKPQDFSYQFPPPPSNEPDPGLNPPILLTFIDSNGRKWCRWPDGVLQDLGVIHHQRRWLARKRDS
jgi:hypothetical protein